MAETIDEKQEFIKQRISNFKTKFENFRNKSDDFAFTGLCLKSYFYRNPNLETNGQQLEEMIIDGPNDGGCDGILMNNEDDASELILCQSKYTTNTNIDEAKNAINKLIGFYEAMQAGQYGQVNEKARHRYATLTSENDFGDESKVLFFFFTKAPQKSIKKESIKKVFDEHFKNDSRYELHIEFLDDIYQTISEAESIRGCIEEGCIDIEKENSLTYNNDQAVIVNISAFSLMTLYSLYGNNLLAQNLRYYFRSKNIDEQINGTIKNNPTDFWYRNNGITIICDDFDFTSSNRIKLKNFSIINGGQTTTLIGKSKFIDKSNDFFLTCKIIKNPCQKEEDKSDFVLQIAQATNSQKPIKESDLKANLPEQISFSKSMLGLGIQYITKKGEKPKSQYSEKYQNLNISKAGKLGLAGIFQLPASSRNKPSIMYKDAYYNPLFLNNNSQKALFIKDLLYIEYVFNYSFLPSVSQKYYNDPTKSELLSFMNNSRTISIAFAAFASRYLNNNIDKNFVADIIDHSSEPGAYDRFFYDRLSNLGSQQGIFNDDYDKMNKDKIQSYLSNLFEQLGIRGNSIYKIRKTSDPTLTPSNFLKKDENYFSIIGNSWEDLERVINNCSPIFKR